jgi:predicted metal-binding membrane protein
MSAKAERPRRAVRLNAISIATFLLAAALATWIVAIERMRGMDAGPGTDLGTLGWYVGVWVTMMAAMMLPSVVPMAVIFGRVSRDRTARHQEAFVPTWIFLAGYLAAWTVVGLAAYGIYRGIRALDPGFLAWQEQGPIVAGGAIVLAGIYQLTPLKRICLRHCRSPLHFVLHGWRPGRMGALRMGLEHGAYCVGCCVGLMLILFALGVMSLLWMAVVAALVFAEKVLPIGERLSLALGVAFIVCGVLVASAPGSVPGLTEPDSPAADEARMRMMQTEPGMQMPPEQMERDDAPGQIGGMDGEMPGGDGAMMP